MIIDDLVLTITRDSEVYAVHTCVFLTAVVSRDCGLASTVKDEDVPHLSQTVSDVGNLTGKTALELAEYAKSDDLLAASIGVAAINSLIIADEKRCVEKNAYEILEERGRGKNVGVVGHFPFIPKLREVSRNLWVFEKKPRDEDLPEQDALHILPQCDVIGITGTTLINHTLEDLLPLCKDGFVVLIGPTTPLTPVLFDYGIDVISGTRVVDQKVVLRYISQGANFRQIRGVKRLTMVKS
ncbi:MAG: DUF364 domain-containing protein [Thermodesulfobacteriota bacterium]|nr:DUF364 domain-containing protein [Thermodesulfobacteriota bacterium]